MVCVPCIAGNEQAKLDEVALRLHGESSASQVQEALHSAAFGDSLPLGQTLPYGPCTLSHDGLMDFRLARFKAPGMAVLGVNVPHDALESMAEVGVGDCWRICSLVHHLSTTRRGM